MSLMNLLQSEDPAIQNGLLNFGLSLLQSKGNFGNAVGQAGVAGQLGARDFRRQQELLKRSAIGDQLLQQQLADQQHRAKIRDLPAQFNQTLPQGMEGPQGFDTPGYLQALSGLDPMMAMQMRESMRQRAPQPIKLGEGDQLLDPNTYKPVASNPKAIKPESMPSAVQEYQFAATQGYKGTFNDWVKEKARAGASSVNVPINMGQKGFDNTLKLRGDFRSEPVYKAHQEMQSAYSQIQQSLKQESPAGDLAGATKIMKLLDPGSVVRESELGMAMAASGLIDRAQNYASMVLKGTKLTPTQRADFQKLADALYGESVKQYNTKRGEYQGIAERNQLSVPDVLGSESAAPNGGWKIEKVK